MFGKDYGPGSPSTPPKGGRKRSSPASKDPEVLGSQVPKSGISASPSLAVRTHQPHGSGAVQTRAARPTAPSTTEPGEDLLREAQLRALGLLSAASELRLWPPNSVSAEPVPAMPVAPATPAAPAAFASSIAPGAQNIPSRARQFCGSASQEAGARDLGTAAQPGPHPRGQGPRPLPGVEPRLPALNAFHEPTRGLDIASVTCSADIRALPPPSAPSGTGFPSERKEPGSSHRAPIGHPSRATASGSDKDSHGHTVTGEVSLTKQGIESARKMEIKCPPPQSAPQSAPTPTKKGMYCYSEEVRSMVLDLLSQGLSGREVRKRTGISEMTISRWRRGLISDRQKGPTRRKIELSDIFDAPDENGEANA